MPLNPLQNATPKPRGPAFDLTLPQPYETTRRTNKPMDGKPEEGRRRLIVFTPQLVESSSWSSRTNLVRRHEDVACEAAVIPVVRIANKDHQPSSNVQYSAQAPALERKSLASSIFFPKEQNLNSPAISSTDSQPANYFGLPVQTSVQVQPPLARVPEGVVVPAPAQKTSLVEKKEILPIPIETSRRSNKRQLPAPIETDSREPKASNLPPTPPLLGPPSPPRFTPKPIESTYRTNRKPLVRPLVPQKAEEAPKTNLSRKPDMNIDLQGVVQPISTARWSNRIKLNQRHFRRTSTVQPLGTPGPYYFVPATGQSSESSTNASKAPEKWFRPEDHVEHLGEPVDSTPPTPSGSPGTSRCPSLSSSPSAASSPISSAASSSWEVDKHFETGTSKIGRRESLDAGYSEYMMDLQRRGRSGSAASSISSAGSTTSDTCTISRPQTAKARRESEDDASSIEPEIAIMRAKARGETIKPAIKIEIPQADVKKVYDDYPICASPMRDKFLPPPKRVPTPELKPAPLQSIGPKAEPTYNEENSGANLPPPPNQPAVLQLGRFKLPVVRVMYSNPIAPSPGITVASLPPRPAKKLKSAGVPEEPDDVTDDFVRDVWNYLSLGHECMARKYDEELAEYTGKTVETVKKDRFLVLKEYIRLWVGQNPTVEGGEQLKGGLW